MSAKSNTYRRYLKDLSTLLLERALEAKEMRSASKQGELERIFEDGRLQGYYETLSLMQQQAIAFEIPLEEIGLADLKPDKQLV